MLRRLMRRRRKRKMAENLSDVPLSPPPYDESQGAEAMTITDSGVSAPPSYDESQVVEASGIIVALKAKANADREEVRERLNHAKEVKTEDDEGLYNGLFGMLVQDSVDSILKKEVVRLTVEMCRFRRNISEKMLADRSRDNAPMNIARLPEGFNEAWRLWRLGEEGTREEASYQALITALEKE